MYKTELSSMSKQVTKLEADCLAWKERWIQTSQAVNRLIEVNQSLENDLMLSDKKLDQLASLCRFLQNERNCYLKQLKENNIKPEVTSLPDEKSETSDAKGTKEKTTPMTAKERELAALRSEIIKLQSEINKAVEKEMEEKTKAANRQEMEKNKRRAKNKNKKKSGKTNGDESKVDKIQEPTLSKTNFTEEEKQENTADKATTENLAEETVMDIDKDLSQQEPSENCKTDLKISQSPTLEFNDQKQTCSISNNGASNLTVNEENGALINT